ncbi:MAG: CTP-dependent riboflavin kinase, partial [Methanosphaera sp.]|nr:CTP-dependent riboflavin kinase [Methanosphaera sp.]
MTMIVEGKVKSGLGKACNFMEKEVYKNQYMDKLGYIPFKGTLNIKLDEELELDINKINSSKINGDDEFGDVYFVDAVIYICDNKSIINNGSILFPVKSIYNTDTLEFISKDNLRQTLRLKDDMCLKVE